MFNPDRHAPGADYFHPTVPARGVVALFVNGRLALADGTATGVAAGRVLLRPTPAGCQAPARP